MWRAERYFMKPEKSGTSGPQSNFRFGKSPGPFENHR
jgi:hypothetical protein